MKNGLRILFLLGLLMVLTGVGQSSAESGLICGWPDDPIPCSTFNTSSCTYTLNEAANCCIPSSPSPRCHGICC